jgi:hypothetical protein
MQQNVNYVNNILFTGSVKPALHPVKQTPANSELLQLRVPPNETQQTNDNSQHHKRHQ